MIIWRNIIKVLQTFVVRNIGMLIYNNIYNISTMQTNHISQYNIWYL